MVEFTAEGQVRPSVKAAAKLGELKGLWRLVPEVGHMMLLQRVATGAKAGGRQVRLAGTFDSNNDLHNALSMIAMGQQDGALHIISGDLHKVLYFRKGVLLSARSTLPEDRLGNLLVRVGLLSSEDRDKCLPEVRAGQPLGTVLVSKGIMTTPKVYDGLKRQTEEIFYSILPWQTGAFYLVAPLDMTEVPTMLHLNTTELLMDGVRRLDEEGEGEETESLRRIEPLPASELPAQGIELIVETYNKALRGLFSSVGDKTATRLKNSMSGFVQESLPFHELFFGVEVGDDGSLTSSVISENAGKTPTEAAIHNIQLGLSEILFFALFAAGEEVTPELEHQIQEEVAAQLRNLPQAAAERERARKRRDSAAPRSPTDFTETAKVDLSDVAAKLDAKAAAEQLIDDEMIAKIFEDDEDVEPEERNENSVIAAIVDEEFAVESLADAEEDPDTLVRSGSEAEEPLLLGGADDFELSLDQDEEIMSLLDKVAEAQAEEAVAREKEPRSPSAEFDRLLTDDGEDADEPDEAAETGP